MILITIIKRTINYLKVKNAIKQANRMHKLTRKRYYVIKIFNKIRVYDRKHIDFLIDNGVLSKKLKKAIELQKICLYHTGMSKE